MSGSFFILELVGTVAFAVSGAVVGLNKRMDVLGVVILAVTTAVGGGALRDVVLGITPPNMFRDPVYTVLAVVTGLVIFLPKTRALIKRDRAAGDRILFWIDSVGLGIFTAVGVQTAEMRLEEPGVLLLLFVGVITGCGGGLMRDVMAGVRPYILTKHFYACASLIGSAVCACLWDLTSPGGAMIAATVVVVALRWCAATFRWSLPKGTPLQEDEESGGAK